MHTGWRITSGLQLPLKRFACSQWAYTHSQSLQTFQFDFSLMAMSPMDNKWLWISQWSCGQGFSEYCYSLGSVRFLAWISKSLGVEVKLKIYYAYFHLYCGLYILSQHAKERSFWTTLYFCYYKPKFDNFSQIFNGFERKVKSSTTSFLSKPLDHNVVKVWSVITR